MRITLNIDDQLLDEARSLSGINDTAALVRAGLEALIARESARRLALLGGTQSHLRPVPRRVSPSAKRHLAIAEDEVPGTAQKSDTSTTSS